MRRPRPVLAAIGGAFVLGGLACSANAQTITGSTLALRSTGAASGGNWTLSSDGYVGTYITLTQPTAVTLTANASGTASNSVAPDMTFSIADYNQSFSVSSSSLSNYVYTTPVMPAGTYFVRTQLDNQSGTATPALTIGSLTVGGTGVSVANTNTDANALAASNSYITNFRQGPGTVKLVDSQGNPLPAGTQMQVKMVRNAFTFGGAVTGNNQSDINNQLVANPAAGSNAANFEQFVNTYMNGLVPSNVGKWADDESTQNSLSMGAADTVAAYAKSHGMTMRMHNVIWGTQQPTWVNTLLTSAQSTNATTKANAITALNTAITNRIGYYVGGGDPAAANNPNNQKNTVTGDIRAQDYSQIDVLNEALRTSPYWNILGASGVANIYSQVATAAANAGANVKLYTNEYNVLQNSSVPGTSTNDAYANWYLQNVLQINNAGFGKVVTGIGVQYYPTGQGPAPSPATVLGAIQNLSVSGLPITLSEFGVQSTLTPTQGAQILDDSLRLMYGSPNVNTFMIWGWYGGATSTMDQSSVLVNTDWKKPDGSWDLTAAGQNYVNDITSWTTPNQNLVSGANGTAGMNGYYGTYSVTADGQTSNVSLVQDGNNSNLQVTVLGNSIWHLTNGSTWLTSGNWLNGVPQTATAVATFGNAITTPSTVTLDGNKTVGEIVFNNANSYTIAQGSGGTLTIDDTGNVNGVNPSITVALGNHTISAPVALANGVTITTATGTGITLSGNISETGTGPLVVAGAGSVKLSGANSYTGGTNVTGGTLVIGSNTAIPVGTAVNITGGNVDVQTFSLTPLATPSTVFAEIVSGAIFSSASDGKHTLGYKDVGGGDTLIQYTLFGDATLDGSVNFNDLLILAQNYGKSGTLWVTGDFNYDGNTNFSDLLKLAQNYGQSLSLSASQLSLLDSDSGINFGAAWAQAEAQAVVPEPTTLSLLSIGAFGLLARRRRLSNG